MDIERLQAIEKQLAKQVEANCVTNENLLKLFKMMSTTVTKNIAPTPMVLTAPLPTTTTIPSISRSRLAAPDNFNGD
jgi:hypothetical protein